MVRAINRKEIGDSGASNSFDDQFTQEYLAELQGRTGSENYYKMATSDPQLGMILRLYKNPIKSCNWSFADIDDPTPQEEKIIGLFKEWFFKEYKLPFKTLLNQVLSFLEYGFSVFEIVYEDFEFEGNVYLMPKIKQRLQRSIEKIETKKGIVKQVTATGEMVDIPIENTVFFILNQIGDDWRGESLLRTSFRSWRDKQVYRQIMGIGVQRGAVGVPHMEVPANVDTASADYIAAEELLKNITFNENAYMITKEGYKFSIVNGNFNAQQVQGIIDSLDKSMAISVLVQFIMLGQGSGGGAYALGADQSDLFLDALAYTVELVEEIWHKHITIPLLKLNFGDSVDTERIKLKGVNLNKKAGRELAETLEKYKNAGFIKATLQDEQHIRKVNQLPELSEEEIEKRENEPEPIPPQPPDPNNPVVDPNKPVDDKNVKNIKLSERNVSERKRLIDEESKRLFDFMKGNLLLIKDKLVVDVRNTLNKGKIEIKGLKKIELFGLGKYQSGLEKKLAFLANRGWMEMKKNAKRNNVKLSEDFDVKNLPDDILKQMVVNAALETVEDQSFNMKHKAVNAAQNGSLRGLSVNQTMSNVGKVIDDFIESNKIRVGASLMVVNSVNFGQNEFNRSIENEIWGYEFVAVDDSNTTEICQSLNGKSYSIAGAELSIVTPPLHPNCRSYLEPIYKAQVEEKPDIDDYIPAPSILKEKTII